MKLQYEDQIRLLGNGDPGEILELLLSCANQVPPVDLQLYNFYKEVPVAASAEILYVFGDTLCCRTTLAQSRAIGLDKATIIRCDHLPHAIHASASYNADSDEVTLADFAYVEVLPDRRDAVRVKVPGLCQVTIEAGPDKFQGRLKSISLSGCAVDIADRAQLGTFRYFFLSLNLELKSGGEFAVMRLQSRLLRIEQGEFGMTRCIFLFEHDRRSEDLVGRYAAQRQAEIIRELKV